MLYDKYEKDKTWQGTFEFIEKIYEKKRVAIDWNVSA